jgi:hypothetical protein
MTIGENIKNVSGAMTELPYARLAHAYQMLQPGMQAQLMQSQIAKEQGQAQFFYGRNPASIEAMRERDAMAAQLRAMQGQGLGDQQTMIRPASKPGPAGPGGKPRWNVNDPVMVYRTKTGNHQNPDGTFSPTFQESEPFMSANDYSSMGGVNTKTGGTSRPGDSYNQGGSNQQFGFLHNAYLQSHPGASEWEAGQAVEKLIHANPALANFFGEQPVKDQREIYKTQNAAAKTVHDNALKQYPLPANPIKAQIDSAGEYEDYIKNFSPKNKSDKPMAPAEYADKVYTQRIRDKRNQLDQVYSGYTSMKPGVERPDYDSYLQEHLKQQQQAPSNGNPY